MKKYDKEFKKETLKKYFDGYSMAFISREIRLMITPFINSQAEKHNSADK